MKRGAPEKRALGVRNRCGPVLSLERPDGTPILIVERSREELPRAGDSMTPRHTAAVLFAQALANSELMPAELEVIRESLKALYSLDECQLPGVMNEGFNSVYPQAVPPALSCRVQRSLRALTRTASEPEREMIIEKLHAVASSDGHIDRAEAALLSILSSRLAPIDAQSSWSLTETVRSTKARSS